MVKRLHLYVAREFVAPFLLSVSVFTFVMLLDKLLDLLDMIVSKGVPLRTVAEVFLLLLPSMIAVVIPMGVLAGVLMAVGRLSGDLEITAMKASGVSIFTPMAPLLAIAVLLAGVLVLFNNSILPDANHLAKNLLLDIGTMRPTARIVPGMFVDDVEGYRILVESKDDITGRLHNVVVHENVPGRVRRTITARTGRMEPVSANRMRLVLFDGQMHEMAPKEGYRKLDFSTYSVLVTRASELVRRDRENRGDRELSSAEMRALVDSMQLQGALLRDSLSVLARRPLVALVGGEPIRYGDEAVARTFPPADSLEPRARYNLARNYVSRVTADLRVLRDRSESAFRNASKYRVEIHKKYSIPFACIVFVFLGVPLALSIRQGSAGVALGVSLLFIVVYYLFLIGGEQLADRQLVSPFMAMWAPNIVLGALGAYLTARSLHEGNPVPIPNPKEIWRRIRGGSSKS
ncbi:MAG: LptF/LptG family permease [Candidatus Fermentibacteraceae bacterium]